MIPNISKYALPGIGALCVLGTVAVGVAITRPVNVDIDSNTTAYTAREPQRPRLKSDVPTMDEILEKHLFSKTRKASGANSFSDLLVKGVYVGEKGSVVLSLKSRPTVNLRIWQDNVSQVIKQISDPRDPRQTIVDFLNEWDILEITMKGMTVEHFVTGERETYAVDYTPTKHVADSAVGGYGQGMLAEATSGTKTVARQSTPQAQSAQGLMIDQMRNMMRSMSPEQRAAFAQRMGGQQGQQDEPPQQGDRQQGNNTRTSGGSSTRTSGSSGGGSSGGGSSGGGSSGGRSR
ncbi:hypothetical protein PDESU_03732 [Pontiella desulfatans]|uniref:Uncharacterized protein n=1 Tax=Pontiella desulfatans TaxID=2750659 RepID=A0A6C2U581_PONDE|nr:hypothetical protein [Pontiella desulfatans]VGO15150.1 hypothetical protein PDESU_03732 [Pontiella desulfatans]